MSRGVSELCCRWWIGLDKGARMRSKVGDNGEASVEM